MFRFDSYVCFGFNCYVILLSSSVLFIGGNEFIKTNIVSCIVGMKYLMLFLKSATGDWLYLQQARNGHPS